MATWVNEKTTSSGGNISLIVSGGYGNVSRNGSSITFNWGVRFKQSSSTYTYNSICARPGGTNYYAVKSSGGSHTAKDTWYYATSTSNSNAKYTSETIPFSGSGTAGGTGAGTITVTVGTAWNGYTPTTDKYSYSFTVSYPAAASYTVSYNANGGSGAPGSQTKYQGYNLTLSSTVPTRAGYRFDGWSGSNGSSYSAGSTYTGNAALTLTAKWTALNPVFTAPGLTATETTLSWPAFTANVNSNFSYQVDGAGSWTSIGSNTTTASAGSIPVSPGTTHTITFRAANASSTSLTTDHSSSGTAYNYPYISNITSSVNVGGTQTFTLYNPLGRSVKVQINSINGVTIASNDEAYASQTTSTTSTSFTIPINAAKKMTSTKSATIVYSCIYGSNAPTKSGTVTVPDSLGPSITDSKKSSFFEYTDCATVTIGSTSYGMNTATGSATRFLQGKSKMKYRLVSANNPFTAQYGASISTYQVKINSKTATTTTVGNYYYEGSSGGVTTEANAQVVTATNTYTITISATDSRGITSSYNLTFTTYPYSTPQPVISQVYRTDGFGTGVTLVIAGTWSPNMTGQHIANTITLFYRQSGTSTYNSKVLYSDTGSATSYKALAGTYNLASSPISLSFDSGKAWDFYVQAKDVFGGTVNSGTASITLGEPIMFIDAEQVGVGVNCFPEGKGLYVGSDIKGKAVYSNNKQTITYYEINTSSLSASNFYPVVFNNTDNMIDCEIHSPNVSGSDAYNQNVLHFQLISQGWSDTPPQFTLLQYNVYSASEITIGCVGRGTQNGNNCVWVRGGRLYRFYSNTPVSLKTANTTIGTEVFTVGTGYSGGSNTNVTACFTPAPNTTESTPGWSGGLGPATAMLAAYPVGTLYLSWNSTSPASLFGGTWQRLSGGYIYGCVSGSGTSGSGTNTGGTTLTANQSGLRDHTHGMQNHYHYTSVSPSATWCVRVGTSGANLLGGESDSGTKNVTLSRNTGPKWTNGVSTASTTYNTDVFSYGQTVGNNSGGPSNNTTTGSGSANASEAHSHSVPYIAVFVWRRTA